ncbi:LysR family transcriptional regulator [Ruminococcaceae bacterium BL-6]|jgi:DNA-binding transcriptional LysR family regulator|nr:LysR family transcriptional regulator [Ruminococcaceae bacterium BL-6]
MDEQDFELLAALDKTKNITHAADKLYVTQSSLSKRINAIEQELGITLFVRSRQGVHFTPEGEEVLKRTMAAAAQLKLMREAIDASRNYVCGTLKAGISLNYAINRLPGELAVYRKNYPHVSTYITADNSRQLYMMLMDGVIDVAIIRGEYPWAGCKFLLEKERICAICSSEDKEKLPNSIPYIGRKSDKEFERKLEQWMRENNFRPDQEGIYVDNLTTCIKLVEEGLGWAIVPEVCLRRFSGYIRPLFFASGEPLIRSTYIMYSDMAQSLPQVMAFVHTIRNLSKGDES